MGKRLTSPVDLYRYRMVSDPAVHPHSGLVAYVLKEIDQEKNGYRMSIRSVTIDGTKEQQLTEGTNDTSPQWSPDGTQLAFLRAENGSKQIFTLTMNANEVQQRSHAPHSIGSFAWSPDGRQLVYTVKVNAQETQAVHPTAVGKVYTRTVPKAEGSGLWDGLYSHLFLLDLTSGEETRLTFGNYNAAQPIWSPDGTQIAFLAKRVDDPSIDPDLFPYNDLFTVDLNVREAIRVTDSSLNISQFRYSPDGSTFALLGDDRAWGSGTCSRLYTVSAAGGPVTPLTEEQQPVQPGNYSVNDMKSGSPMPGPLFSSDGKRLFALGTWHGQVHIYRFETGSSPVAVTKGERDFYQLTIASEDRYLIAVAMDQEGPGELFCIDTLQGTQQQLTSWNDAIKQELLTSKPETFWFEAAEGYLVQGWIIRPPTLVPGERVPLVLQIHGGPHAMYPGTYSHEMQTLASQGYAVMYINPRGSFGYGQAFAGACRGDFGGGDYRDLMQAIDVVLQRYDFVDEFRMAVMGGSYGGLMTNWIISQQKRFRAAVSSRSISNWLSFYGMSDIGISYTEGIVGGNPWQHYEILWDKSPLAHVENIETPLLIMHGELDYRCPIGQSDQLYVALKRLGKNTMLIRYPDSNHSFQKLGKPSYRIDVLCQVENWLKTYLAAPIEVLNQPKVQLPLPVAMLIENCRTSGLSEEAIIHSIRERDFTDLLPHVADQTMDFQERAELADELNVAWEQAIRSGYEFGFLHLNGLMRLLKFRYNKLANQDYEQVEDTIINLALDESQITSLQALIHRQWRVEIQYNAELRKKVVNIRLRSNPEL